MGSEMCIRDRTNAERQKNYRERKAMWNIAQKKLIGTDAIEERVAFQRAVQDTRRANALENFVNCKKIV